MTEKKKIIIKSPQFSRETHTIDATGKILGRLSTEIATILRGKNRPSYRPHLEQGNFVNVINASKIATTGKKMAQKEYYHFSGYPGGLKRRKMSDEFAKSPAKVLRQTVWNMLPKNKLRDTMIKRLKITN